jgi:uncharacterized protein YqhQ
MADVKLWNKWSCLLATAALNATNPTPQPFFYGGQAVIEGVLMRGPKYYAVAARKPDGSITSIQSPLTSRVYTSNFWKRPFLRGIAGLIEMMHLGMRSLQWSAGIQLGKEAELTGRAMGLTILGSMVFAIFLFVILPATLGGFLYQGPSTLSASVVEGIVRGLVLLLYLFAIGQVPAVKRVFEYHGAEHKTINCFEHSLPLDVQHVGGSSRLHPRCGTGFIVMVALLSIFIFAPVQLMHLSPVPSVLLRILLIPLVGAVAYEGIRLLATMRDSWYRRLALVPILQTQNLTTREPDPAQIEVAVYAFQLARQADPSGPIGEGHAELVH